MRWSVVALLTASLAAAAPSRSPPTVQPARAAPGGSIQGAFFALSVADAKGMADWYRKSLGFRTLLERDLPERKIVAVLLERDGSIVELIQRADTQPAPLRDGKRSAVSVYGIFKLGLTVSDLQGLHDRLAQAGTSFDYHIVQPEGHSFRTFAVRDPEGNIVQFFG